MRPIMIGMIDSDTFFCMQTALGPQMLSTIASSPVSGFGTAKRPSMATKSGVPGPGAYKLKNTVGKACPYVVLTFKGSLAQP